MLKQVQHDEAARQFPTPFPPFHRLRPIVSKRTFAWHGICPRGAVLQLKCLVPSPDRTSPTIWKPPPESRPQAASSGVKSRPWLIAARPVFSRTELGRASCRERMSSYGELEVVSGYCTKE